MEFDILVPVIKNTEASIPNIPRCKRCGEIPVVRMGSINTYEEYDYAFFVVCPKCGESSEGFFNLDIAKTDWIKKNESD